MNICTTFPGNKPSTPTKQFTNTNLHPQTVHSASKSHDACTYSRQPPSDGAEIAPLVGILLAGGRIWFCDPGLTAGTDLKHHLQRHLPTKLRLCRKRFRRRFRFRDVSSLSFSASVSTAVLPMWALAKRLPHPLFCDILPGRRNDTGG